MRSNLSTQFLSIILFTLITIPCACQQKEKPIEEITLGFNVLKPYHTALEGKSHEEINIKKDKSIYTLTASINTPPYTQKTAKITEQEWDEIITLVKDSKILQWKKKEFINPEVNDGASIVLQFKLSDQSEINYSWQNTDRAGANEIISYLIRLANKNIPDNPLYHLSSKH